MPQAQTDPGHPVVDLAVIGGGVNGAGIARDAAGRGWTIALIEQGDLAQATSSASTKLIHGGLRYLEQYAFRLVREALAEREVIWRIAPHIVWPLTFVLPHDPSHRPAWLIRLGLFLYDHLGGRQRLPRTRVLDLRAAAEGAALREGLTRGFAYADCWVDDARLVVLNARDAADRGARLLLRTRCLRAERDGGLWRLTLEDTESGLRRDLAARALVNAAGPWVARVLKTAIGMRSPVSVRLVRGSHIVVPRLFDHACAYLLQNTDGRVVFAIPYEDDFTLIGTTDVDHDGDLAEVRATGEEVLYLCRAVSLWFRRPVAPSDVIWSYAGVRPLYDDGASAAQEATRDYVLALDAPAGAPALLSVFGGKITTYRRLAEAALAKLAPHLPVVRGLAPGWTGRTPLPGGDFPIDGVARLTAEIAARFPFLDARTVRRLARSYGTLAPRVLGDASTPEELGRDLGAGLTEAELLWLVRHEWARTAEDVLWRRTKLGLRLDSAGREAVARAMDGLRTEATA
ncbi:MAG: glycerol-3-phosphate dehydrogenase [Acetobacteraceae bacterium]|nr:glycerol-3-phosphate dehydrogenase [Acetobacteraceae bacterium]